MDYILEMSKITKEFPGVKALNEVDLKIERGEIHTICGENGAGKSTLMKVLSGVYPASSFNGDIFFDGQKRSFDNITDSENCGIAIIYQELALVPQMSIYENIFLGHEKAKRGIIDWQLTSTEARKYLDKVGVKEDTSIMVSELGVGKQQLVEIAKALAKNAKLLIFDEPTASLNDADSENLLKIIMQLKEEGITCILISHKLNEVMAVSDNITIIRDGQSITRLNVKSENITEDTIIKHMVGREMTQRYPSRDSKIGEVKFEVQDWTVLHPEHRERKVLDNININVKAGEIVGISGLMGSGRTELALSIFGDSFGFKKSGKALLNGKVIDVTTPQRAIKNKLAYLSEDRKEKGLILMDDIKQNLSLANLSNYIKKGVLDHNAEIVDAKRLSEEVTVKASSINQEVGNLSGGNQQKVALGKWLAIDPEVLILDEPTRGVDVGAKYEIYQLVNKLVAQNRSVIIISSELPEIIGMSDRVYVLSEGKIAAELTKDELSQEKIMSYSIK